MQRRDLTPDGLLRNEPEFVELLDCAPHPPCAVVARIVEAEELGPVRGTPTGRIDPGVPSDVKEAQVELEADALLALAPATDQLE